MKFPRKPIYGAHAVVASFLRNAVRDVFIFPGGTIAPILDVIEKETKIRIICPRNEQGAGYAALAYAKVTDRPAVFMVTSGPGVTNAVTPVADAYYDNVPMVVITGQVGTGDLRGDIPVKQRGFQEVDTVDLMRPITKAAFIVKDPKELSDAMERAFFLARTGRMGPVVVDMPMNVQRALLPHSYLRPKTKFSFEKPALPLARLRSVARLLIEAERPVILAGGGVIASHGERELRTLADRLQIPVAMSLPGMGAYPTTRPLSLGLIGYAGSQYANNALHRADLVLCVGTTLHVRQTGSVTDKMAPNAKIVRIDIDDNEIRHSRIAHDISIHADAHDALGALVKLVRKEKLLSRRTAPWLKTMAAWKEEFPLTIERQRGKYVKPQRAIACADQTLRGEIIVTTGVGQHQIWVPRHFSFDHPKRMLLTSSGHGTMGYDVPAAIGAKLARPNARVLCIVGDGSLQMNIQELATIAEMKLDIKILVLDNHALNIVAQFQRQNWKSHPSTGGRYNPDFARIAQSYGIAAISITSAQTMKRQLSRALRQKGPVLIHCDIDPKEDLLPMLLGGHTLDDMENRSSF